MTVKGSVTFSVVILFALISFPFPAVPQVAPPCCTTPPILEEIALRPQEESLIDFKQWLDDRKHSPNGSSWRSDVSALLGACA